MQRGEARTLAAVLFTDMVDSTAIAEELGDRRWKALVDAHHRIVRRELKRFGGTELDTAGDGFFASFKEPAPAIACASACVEAVRELGVEIRAGIHFGECERIGKKLGGITVVVGARIMALGSAGEVLVSSTAAELARGAGFGFEDRGMRTLKGVEGDWRVFAATAVDGKPRPAPLARDDAKARRDRIETETPRRRRTLVAVGVAAALVLAAAAVPEGARRLQRGLPGLDANAVGTIDPGNGHITAQVPLGDIPNGIAFGAGSTWVALEATGEVARVDPAAGTVLQRISVGVSPTGVAFGEGAVWVTNTDSRSVSWIDPASDKAVQEIAVGNAPTAIAFGEGFVWVANTLDGTVTKIDPANGSVTRVIPVGADPIGIAVGAGSVWVANQASSEVARIDPATGAVKQRVGVGEGPSGLTFDGSAIWVANAQSGTVMRIDPASNDVTGTVQVDGAPSQVAAGAGRVWAADPDGNVVTEIDPEGSGHVAGTTPIENAPRSLAFDGNDLWVTARGSAASHQGGTLIAESSLVPGFIDPNASYDPFSYAITINTNDGLLAYARVGGSAGSVLVPDLAASIPRPMDRGKTYTFDLRPGIRYSDGTTVMPSDVLASFERAFRLDQGPLYYLSALRGAADCSTDACDLSAGIEPDDEQGTVTFHLTRPDPSFLDILAMPFLSIVPASTPPHPIAEAPFVPATGPYMIDSYTVPGDPEDRHGTLLMVRNPSFQEWSHAAQPAGFPETIEIRFGLDLDQATTDVQNGSADVLLDSPPVERLQEIRTRFAAQSHPYSQLGLLYLFLNTEVAPFSDVDVRRAINLAVNRTEMSKLTPPLGLTGAGGPPTCQVLPPGVPGYAAFCQYTNDRTANGAPDPLAARDLVDRSGTTDIPVTVWSFRETLPLTKYVASVLTGLGYRASVRTVDNVDEYFHYIADTSNRAQIGVAGWVTDTPEASGVFGPLLTCRSIVRNNPYVNSNYSQFCDTSIDRQIERAARIGVTDPASANRLWQQIDEQVMGQAPWVPFTTPSGTILVSARVGNYQYNPVLGVLLGQMWVTE